jgi:hypothetical protein
VNQKSEIQIDIEFNSIEEFELFKASQVGAGITGDMSQELKDKIKKLYKEQTGEDLPDGTYYIDPNYSDIIFKNIFVSNPDFKKNIG